MSIDFTRKKVFRRITIIKCIVDILEKQLNKKIFIPHDPQIVGAIGAATHF